MMLEFTVGINIAGKHESVTVAAEDALIAALKVKCERPDALINYVRRRNRRGDIRHPHGASAAKAEGSRDAALTGRRRMDEGLSAAAASRCVDQPAMTHPDH